MKLKRKRTSTKQKVSVRAYSVKAHKRNKPTRKRSNQGKLF